MICKSNLEIDQALNTFQIPWNFNTSLIQNFQFDKVQPEHTPCRVNCQDEGLIVK